MVDTTPYLDVVAVSEWLEALYSGVPAGHKVNVCSPASWTGRFFDPADAEDAEALVDYITKLDEQGTTGIYLRITTVAKEPEPGKRGLAEDSTYIPGFWADIDVKGPGHKSTSGKLPETFEDAKAIVAASCLPEPTYWVASGGGFYPWWLLETPAEITADNIEWTAKLSEDVQAELRRAAMSLDMELAPMADLARVLRLPGTVNRKVPGAPTQCEIIERGGRRYPIAKVRENIPEVTASVSTSNARNTSLGAIWDALPEGPPCSALVRKAAAGIKRITEAETGGRHKAAQSAIASILALSNFGHAGGREALDTLRQTFDEVKPPAEQGPGEWDSMIAWLLSKMDVITEEDRHCCGLTSFTDAHIATRVVREGLCDSHGRPAAIWSAATGWMLWSGTVWSRVEDPVVHKMAADWFKEQYRVAVDRLRFIDPEKEADRKQGEDLVKQWSKYLMTPKIKAVVELARGEVRFDPALMDADPDILNTPSGVLDLATGELMPHTPSRLVSKITEVDYAADAQDEGLDRLLDALPADVLPWFQIKVGQAATGHPLRGEDPVVFAHGGGMNGKSTVMDLISSALGGYAVVAPSSLLTNGSRNHNEVMVLFGARMAITEELEEGSRLVSKALKDLTDTSNITGCFKFKDTVTFAATHSLFVTTNVLPVVQETTHAAWRRISQLKFPYTYVTEDRPLADTERRADPLLRLRVAEKDVRLLRAVLRWIVEGSRQWYAMGRRTPLPPARVADDTREWRRETDMILSYYDSGRVKADTGYCVTADDLYADFATWLTDRGIRPPAQRQFTAMFREHSETVRSRITSDRPKAVPRDLTLSRPENPVGAIAGRPSLWIGLAFDSGTDGGGTPSVSVPDDDPWAS